MYSPKVILENFLGFENLFAKYALVLIVGLHTIIWSNWLPRCNSLNFKFCNDSELKKVQLNIQYLNGVGKSISYKTLKLN